MSASDLGLVFSILLIICITVDNVNASNIAAMQVAEEQYNLAIDNAVESALYDEIEMDDREMPFFNHDVVIEKFFDNLYINFGIMENQSKKMLCSLCIPLIICIDSDGFYIYAQRMDEQEGRLQSFYEKRKFSYQSEEGELEFTLNRYVNYWNDKEKYRIEGYYYDVVQKLPIELQWSQKQFEENRKNTVINALEEAAEEYMNYHNRIAEKYGITYQFTLPVISKEEWYRTIEDIGIIVFFQGYPFGNRLLGCYNRMAVGAARLKKSGVTAPRL